MKKPKVEHLPTRGDVMLATPQGRPKEAHDA